MPLVPFQLDKPKNDNLKGVYIMAIQVSYYFMNPYTECMEYPTEKYEFSTFEEFKQQFEKARKRVNAFKAWNCEPVYKII